MSRLASFIRLTTWERRVFLRALLLLPLTAMRIRWLGLGRALAVVDSAPSTATAGGGGEAAHALLIAHLVDAAARHGPFRASCLPRSLTLHRLLREGGIDVDLRLGVRKVAGRLEAHAWIERDGQALLESAQVLERFAAFAGPVAPRAGASR